MALARRGSRTIEVAGVNYRWVVSPDDGCMAIVVEHEASPGQRLEAFVGYREGGPGGGAKISPRVVRRAILLGLGDGWRPLERGLPNLRLLDADARVWEDGA
jgi:hypothetical protein